MAVSQAAYKVEQAIGHDDPSIITQQDVANYSNVGEEGGLMKALVWQGKNKVEIGKSSPVYLSAPTACRPSWASSVAPTNKQCSRRASAQGPRRQRCDLEGHGQHGLRQ